MLIFQKIFDLFHQREQDERPKPPEYACMSDQQLREALPDAVDAFGVQKVRAMFVANPSLTVRELQDEVARQAGRD